MTATQFFCVVLATRKWGKQNFLTMAFLEIDRLAFFLTKRWREIGAKSLKKVCERGLQLTNDTNNFSSPYPL